MNLQFYVEKLKNSDVFKNFMKAHPDAFPCSGFFIIDKTGKEGNKQHFDFYLLKDNKMIGIQLEDMQLVPIETFGKVPEEISLEHDFDFDEVEKMIEKRMVEEKIKNKIQKLLFSFQHLEGEDLLVGTVFISILGMIKVVINLKKMEMTEFERKSFFDIMKVSKKKNKKD